MESRTALETVIGEEGAGGFGNSGRGPRPVAAAVEAEEEEATVSKVSK